MPKIRTGRTDLENRLSRDAYWDGYLTGALAVSLLMAGMRIAERLLEGLFG